MGRAKRVRKARAERRAQGRGYSAQRLQERLQEARRRQEARELWSKLTPAQRRQAQAQGLQGAVESMLEALGVQRHVQEDDLDQAPTPDPWDLAQEDLEHRCEKDVVDVEWEVVE